MNSTMEAQMTESQFSDEEENCIFAVELAGGSFFPMVLKSAIELDVLEIIARANPPGAFMSAEEIASQLSTKNPDAPVMLDAILRVLASCSVLTCSLRSHPDGKVERLYGLAPVCKFLTKNEDGVSLSALALYNQDKVAMESWYYLKDAVLEGVNPFEKAHGVTSFEYFTKDSRLSKIFNNAMSSLSIILMKYILQTYKGFESLKSIVDVGGGTGASVSMIISKYPSIKGINFDLPHVVQDAPSYPGVQHLGGDMLVAVPKAEAIFMKFVLHDWDDENCSKILKNCYKALPSNGKIIACEYILPVFPETNHASKVTHFINCKMMCTPGGQERTLDEFKKLAMGAGFQGVQVICRAAGIYVMEFVKKA